MKSTLYYIHDPMCSWCWGFNPVLTELLRRLPVPIHVTRLLGGLAPDSSQPMPAEIGSYVQNTWRKIQREVPGTKFNFDFWSDCKPRRSTYPACRAVIAARQQGDEYDKKMTCAIQRAYYMEARNPSDSSTLIELANEIGLNTSEFSVQLDSAITHQQLLSEIDMCRQLNAVSFPSLILQMEHSTTRIPIDYTDSSALIELIHQIANRRKHSK